MKRFSLTEILTAVMLFVLGALPARGEHPNRALGLQNKVSYKVASRRSETRVGRVGAAAALFEHCAELRGAEAAELETRAARVLVGCGRDRGSLVASVANEAFRAFCAQVGMGLERPRDYERFASGGALAKQNFRAGSPMDLVSLRSFKIFSGEIMRPVVRIKKARRRVYRRRAGRLQPWIFIP